MTNLVGSGTLFARFPHAVMPEAIPPNVHELSRHYVDGRRFASSDEVLVFAMDLFVEFERQYQEELGASLKQASDAIEAGEGIELNGKEQIEDYFQNKIRMNRLRVRSQDI